MGGSAGTGVAHNIVWDTSETKKKEVKCPICHGYGKDLKDNPSSPWL